MQDSQTMRYTLNSPNVISEVLDGESIILNMVSGKYYSIKDSGLYIWQATLSGCTRQEMASALAKKFPSNLLEIEREVGSLVDRFVEEELVRPSENTAAPDVPAIELAEFSPPLLEAYTDMQEMLLLDPIHEVEETGWPHKKQD